MYDVYGVLCATYDEACQVAGCDTDAQLEWESRNLEEEWLIECQDGMEARGGPKVPLPTELDDDIPF